MLDIFIADSLRFVMPLVPPASVDLVVILSARLYIVALINNSDPINVTELKPYLLITKRRFWSANYAGFEKRQHVISYAYGYCFTPQVRF